MDPLAICHCVAVQNFIEMYEPHHLLATMRNRYAIIIQIYIRLHTSYISISNSHTQPQVIFTQHR